LICLFDAKDEEGYIDDLKTSKASKGQGFADGSMAISCYGVLHRAHYGENPKGYRIQNVITSKSGTRTKTFETERTEAQLNQQIARFARGLEAIKTGVFLPCDPGHWKCSEQYCGFWRQCEFGGGK